MSTDIKLSETELSKIIKSGKLPSKTLGNLSKKSLLDLAVSLAKYVLPKLATNLATSRILDKLERKISRVEAVRAGKRFTLFISNEDMNDTAKILEPLRSSSLLIDGATEKVKHEIKKQEGGFVGAMVAIMTASLIPPMDSSLIQPVASLIINFITGKGQKAQKGGFLPLLALSLMMKVLGRGVTRAGNGYNNMNNIHKKI